MHTVWGIILASGMEEQLSDGIDTAFVNLAGKPILGYSFEAFERCPEIDGVAVVAPKERLLEIQQMVQMLGYGKVRRIAAGAKQRHLSVRTGLQVLDEDVSIVVIHEAARPCVTSDLIGETVKAAKRYGAAIAAARVTDPVKLVPKGQKVTESLPGGAAWAAQTPQAFKRDILEKALKQAGKRKGICQDEAEAVQRAKKPVHIVQSTAANLRVSTTGDLALAEALIRFR